MYRKTGWLLCVLLGLFVVWTDAAQAANGYRDTVDTWDYVVSQVTPYQLTLQNLYAEVESLVGPDKSRLNVAFNRRLASQYPGSAYYGGCSGTLAVNNYTKMGFNSQWEIISLSQKFGSLVKVYNFRMNTLEIGNGPNQISMKLDLYHPDRSRFTHAVIPALSVTARDIWSRKRERRSYGDPMVDILNDVYASRMAAKGVMRMDELAESMVNDEGTRASIMRGAQELYRDGTVRTQAGSAGSRAETATPPVRSSTSGIKPFALVPWYFWPAVVGIGIFGAVAQGQRRRKTSRTARGSRSGGADDVRYESRETLNSPAEQAFYRVLQEVIDSDLYQINGKTRLADLIQVEKNLWGVQWSKQFNRISRKHVDFVLLEKSTSRIVGVIELDDGSHRRPDRQARDRFVDRALQKAGIPILHYPCLAAYNLHDVQKAVNEAFGLGAEISHRPDSITFEEFFR